MERWHQHPGWGQLVAYRRKQRRWSQAHLARESGVAPNTVGNIERGVSSPPQEEKLRALLRALDLPTDFEHAQQAVDMSDRHPSNLGMIIKGTGKPLDEVRRLIATMTPEQQAELAQQMFAAVLENIEPEQDDRNDT